MSQRAQAFETDDDALRCYIDQLPVDRCVFCARPQQPRQIHVAGPVHTWSEMHELADTGSVGDKLFVAGKLISGGPVARRSQQTKGTVSMAVCIKCAPSPKEPLIASAGLLVVAIVLFAIHQIAFGLVAVLGLAVALAIATKRMKLSVGEIDEDDFMFKIRGLDEGVKAEVLALGAAPHPSNTGRASFTS